MHLFLLLLGLATSTQASPDLKLAADNPAVLQAVFSQFQKDEGREYATKEDARQRMNLFRSFVKEAAKEEAQHDDVTLGVTFFADMTEEEKKSYYGANITGIENEQYDEEDYDDSPMVSSSTVSHRKHYGPIKSQGRCASCWAFGAAGVTEGVQSMAVGSYTALSEQQVLDCSNAGDCRRGGYHVKALNYIARRNNLASVQDYRYSGRKSRCQNRQSSQKIKVTRVLQTRRGSDDDLARKIAVGPVAVLLYNFHGVGVEAYKEGTICPSSAPSAMNHIVVAIGYRQDAWELRNSWGARWGEKGYFWHSRRKRNNIGVSDYSFYIKYQKMVEEEKEK